MFRSLEFFWWGAGAFHYQDLLGEPYVRIWVSALMDVTVCRSCSIFGGEQTPSVCLI